MLPSKICSLGFKKCYETLKIRIKYLENFLITDIYYDLHNISKYVLMIIILIGIFWTY